MIGRPRATSTTVPDVPDARRRLPIAPAAQSSVPPLADEVRAVDRRTRPVHAVWELTLRCDLSCHHCSSRAGKPRADELDTAEALDVVKQLADLGVLEVTLIGGEAYLHPGWTEIVRAIRMRRMECTLVTGGRGMTPERARAAFDAGVMSASVSIDGAPSTHDALRGLQGSHAAALAAMENLARAGVQVSANTQIGRRNRRELAAIFGSIAAAGAHAWQLQLTVAGGRVADDGAALLLQPYQLLEVMPSIARLEARAKACDLRLWAGNNLGYYGPYETLLRGDSVLGRKGSCGAGRAVIGVESAGGIKGCPSLPPAYVGGDVRTQKIVDVWERAQALRFGRESRVPEVTGHCRACYYAEDCQGGCSWTAHSLLGRRGDNPYCHHRALELLRVGRRERVVQLERASGAPFDHGLFEVREEDWPAGELSVARAVAEERAEWLAEAV